MRIAVISDIHGNLLALDSVLADIESRSVDLVVNLGDLLSGGLQPRETGDRLLSLDLLTVRGNHERQVLTLPREQMSRSDGLAYDTMSVEQREWFASLPVQAEPAPGVLAFHASPTDDLVYLLETVDASGAHPATETEVLSRLGPQHGRTLLLGGHTHLQRSMLLATGPLVVNPGSVGWPAFADDTPFPHAMEAGTPHARYAIVDDASGRWAIDFHLVDYDWEAAARIAERNDRSDVAHALRSGRTLPA
ncbi:MAG: metallophosphoesterase family protein [Candidatus Dormibacteria bacterium]